MATSWGSRAPGAPEEHSLNVSLLGARSDEEPDAFAPSDEGAAAGRAPHKARGTILSSTVNLAGTILGSSSLAMAYACSKAGIPLYIVLLLVIGAIGERSIMMLVRCAHLTNRHNYAEIAHDAAGRPGQLAVIISVLVQQLGACVAFIKVRALHPRGKDEAGREAPERTTPDVHVLFVLSFVFHLFSPPFVLAPRSLSDRGRHHRPGGQFDRERLPRRSVRNPSVRPSVRLPALGVRALSSDSPTRSLADLCAPFLTCRWHWQVFIAVAVMLPLCLMRKINSLRISSTLAILLILLFTLAVVIDGAAQVHRKGVDWPTITITPPSFKDVLLIVPIICFAYVCHMNVFPIMGELQDPSYPRMSLVSKISVVLAGVIYILTGTLGYLAFGSNTEPDIIKAYQNMAEDGSVAAGTDHILLPTTAIRVLQFGLGIAITFTFPVVAYELRHSIEQLLWGDHAEVTFPRHAAVVVALIAVSTVLAIAVPGIDTVFGFTGSTTSCFVVFILPALFFLRLDDLPPWSFSWSIAAFQLALGVVLVPVCVVVQILKLA